MSLKLRNRKAAEAQLGQFVEDISLAPKLISAIVEGEARPAETALAQRPALTRSARSLRPTRRTCSTWCSCTTSWSSAPPRRARGAAAAVPSRRSDWCGQASSAVALQDVESELERLRIKAVQKVREFLLQRFYGLRKPKTNIQVCSILYSPRPLSIPWCRSCSRMCFLSSSTSPSLSSSMGRRCRKMCGRRTWRR